MQCSYNYMLQVLNFHINCTELLAYISLIITATEWSLYLIDEQVYICTYLYTT